MKNNIIVILAVSLLFALPTFAQQDMSKIEIKTHHVAGNVYMLEGSGGNIGVSAGEDGILIIDDQYKPLAEKILAALKELNSGDLQFILNTHYHGDHMGGNEVLGKSAPIIAHTNNRARLVDGGTVKEGLPVVTFDDKLSVHFNGEEIKALHIPHGHTDGDLVMFFPKSNVVHLGDLMFHNLFPYVDIDAGGNALHMRDNIKTLLGMIPADAKIIPGHGALTDVAGLKAFHTMLDETIELIRVKMREGKSKETIVAEGLPAKWDSWSWSFIPTDRWIGSVYDSIIK